MCVFFFYVVGFRFSLENLWRVIFEITFFSFFFQQIERREVENKYPRRLCQRAASKNHARLTSDRHNQATRRTTLQITILFPIFLVKWKNLSTRYNAAYRSLVPHRVYTVHRGVIQDISPSLRGIISLPNHILVSFSQHP